MSSINTIIKYYRVHNFFKANFTAVTNLIINIVACVVEIIITQCYDTVATEYIYLSPSISNKYIYYINIYLYE